MVETESFLVRAYDPSMDSNGYENIKKGIYMLDIIIWKHDPLTTINPEIY